MEHLGTLFLPIHYHYHFSSTAGFFCQNAKMTKNNPNFDSLKTTKNQKSEKWANFKTLKPLKIRNNKNEQILTS